MDHNNFDILETRNLNEKYQCNSCDKMFENITILHEHMDMHKSEKPFSCAKCENNFKQKSKLRLHERVHTGKLKHEKEVGT